MKRCHSRWFGLLLFCFLVSGCSCDSSKNELHVKILAINDFHGHISKDGLNSKRAVGSAPVLAAYFTAAAQGFEGRTFIVHAGDLVGASPAASGLLKDEPSIMFLNLLATQKSPSCKIIGTLGNHEFDQGKEELLRLIYGGNHKEGPFLEDPYAGSKFNYVCANVMNCKTCRPLLPPFIIKEIQGIRIAFIGAISTETSKKVHESKISDLHFCDEAETINFQVDLLKKLGVKAIIVLIHEGGDQEPYEGKTKDTEETKVTGKIVNIVSRLDDEVDVVISGHTHKFTNAFIKKKNNKKILVTQTQGNGEAYGDIDLKINRDNKDIVAKWAQIKTTYRDKGPGRKPHIHVSQLVKQAEAKLKEIIGRDPKEVINQAKNDIDKKPNDAGESALGNLVVDSQKAAGQTQFAFVNLGGIRGDKIAAGEVTWGDLFCVEPFMNKLVKKKLTGQNIYKVLEQQWTEPQSPKFLQISGLHYTWKDGPEGSQIVEVWDDKSTPIKKDFWYTITINNFLANGGDNFTEFCKGKYEGELSSSDLDVLVDYIKKLPKPFSSKIEGRIIKKN